MAESQKKIGLLENNNSKIREACQIFYELHDELQPKKFWEDEGYGSIYITHSGDNCSLTYYQGMIYSRLRSFPRSIITSKSGLMELLNITEYSLDEKTILIKDSDFKK